MKRPIFISDEHLKFLNELYAEGNMRWAVFALLDEYPDLEKNAVQTIIKYWREKFPDKN